MLSDKSHEKIISLDDQYKLLVSQIVSLLSTDESIITHLANITAAIKQTYTKVSWVGFYIKNNGELFLGPFQGKVACTRIKIGKGVCGICAQAKETQIVPNVHEFPGHIACDVESNSEIVIPIIYNSEVVAVLDLDSTQYAAFSNLDKHWLEEICNLISKKINFKLIQI